MHNRLARESYTVLRKRTWCYDTNHVIVIQNVVKLSAQEDQCVNFMDHPMKHTVIHLVMLIMVDVLATKHVQ